MEAQTPLVGADGAVHLDPEAAVDLDLPLVVHPGDAEHEDALGLHDALEDLRGTVFGVTVEHEGEGFDHLLHGLVEFGLAGVFGLQTGHENIDVINHGMLLY